MQTLKPIAIIGAGIAGAACARALRERGLPVTVFDKSRGVGGRLATRRHKDWQWDHGAPFLTAASEDFSSALQSLTPCPTSQAPTAWVGVPAQNQLVKQLLENVQVQTGKQVVNVKQTAAGDDWVLSFDQHKEQAGWGGVICAIPAPQAQLILPLSPQRLAAVATKPCWAAMFATPSPVTVLDECNGSDAILDGTNLAKLTAEHLKPGRPQGAGLYVLHATSSWSESHLELSPAQAADLLMAQLNRQLGTKLTSQYVTAHRWRYAQTQTPLGRPYLIDGRLGVCGDWCLGERAEHGYLSGKALGAAFLA